MDDVIGGLKRPFRVLTCVSCGYLEFFNISLDGLESVRVSKSLHLRLLNHKCHANVLVAFGTEAGKILSLGPRRLHKR